jgi:DNA-binding CsgD family transcriptional regulator/tetratricopeptide (TPR) repeat protein
MGDHPGAPFVGREDELREIRSVIEGASTDEARLLVISGEAGVGKSRLVHHAIDTFERRATLRVLVINGIDSGDSPLAFAPFLVALRRLEREIDEDSRKQLIEPIREELANLAAVATTDAGPAVRLQLFERFISLLEGLQARTPLLFVFENLHWADRSSLDLLGFIIANREAMRVGIVVTYRSDEPTVDEGFHRFIAQLGRQDNMRRLVLQRMDRTAFRRHICNVAGTNVDLATERDIWQRSQGNPFYAEELLAAIEDGKRRNGGDSVLPATLREMLVQRLRSVPPETQEMLRTMSAGGDLAPVDHVMAACANAAGTTIQDHIRSAMDKGLLEYDARFDTVRFRHALLREVAYSELLPAERRDIHRRWAAVVESSSLPATQRATELARHYLRSDMLEKAAQVCLEAATYAEQSGGYAEAAQHLRHALDSGAASDDPRVRLQIMERIAKCSHLSGDNDKAIDVTRAALNAAIPASERVKALADLGCYLHAAGRSGEALDVHSEAAKLIVEVDAPELEVEVLTAHAQSLSAVAAHREAVVVARKALAHSQENELPYRESQILALLGHDLVVLGEIDEGTAALHQSLNFAERSGDASRIAESFRTLASMLAGPLNRLEDALDVALTGIARVDQLGLDRHWGVALRSVAIDTLFRMGRWSEAGDYITDALRRSPRGAAAIELRLSRAKLSLGSGDFAQATEDLEAVERLTARAVDLRYRIPLATLKSGLALWQRKPEEALQHVEVGLTYVQETDDVWLFAALLWHGLRACGEQAEDARARGDVSSGELAVKTAEEHMRMVQVCAERSTAAGPLGLLVRGYESMCAGELSRVQGMSDEETWRKAVEAWSELGHPYPTAYCRFREGEALSLSRRKRSGVEAALREAWTIAARMDALPLRMEIESVAKRAGVELHAAESIVDLDAPAVIELAAGTPSLTKREQQVLELVAAGEGNRAIANALFISEKTASVHVSNIMAKLGASSRAQVAAMVHRSRR